MKMIMAIIKPSKLEKVRNSLSALGVTGMTVSEVEGFGRQGGHTEIFSGAEYEIHFVPKTNIEVAVTDDIAESVICVIRENANTDKIGDGKIFVFDIDQVIRIRTGETDVNAL